MKFKCNVYWATVYQLLIPLLLLWLTRFVFYGYNADVIGEIPCGRLMALALSGLRFDVVALAYANALFILMRFLPFAFAGKRWWLRLSFVVYMIANSALLIVNIGDTVFFRFNNGHMQLDAFLSLMNPEMVKVTFGYFGQYWWAFIGIAAVIAAMGWLAARVGIVGRAYGLWPRIGIFLLAAGLTFVGMRGRIVGRPASLDRVADEVTEPREINVVLNTPFCIMRSSSYSKSMPTVTFFTDEDLNAMRSSVHYPIKLAADSLREAIYGNNIMLIVLESGGQIWLDSLNIVEGDSARNLMPFLNSIACQSMALTSTYCTGGRTVEGLASILGGVPTFGQQNWMATKYGSQTVDAPARLLTQKGYASRFFLGAKPSAFSLGPLASAMGFAEVTGRYDVDLSEDGNTNSWGFYDHVMGRYVAESLGGMAEPFFAAWLTLDLHSPFNIPADWDSTGYPATESDMERCVEYTDWSLRQFFEAAERQPWFDNTLFVITADHGFRDFTDPKYNGAYIYGHIPFLLYTPDGSLPAGKYGDRPMAQFDIPVTLLWLAGYDKPYVAVGTNWFDDTKPHYGVQMRNDIWQITSSRYLVQMPQGADSVTAVFDIVNDQQLLTPLTEYDRAEVDAMVGWFRAFLQDYTTRANTAALTLAQ